jgi:hypothetical protein
MTYLLLSKLGHFIRDVNHVINRIQFQGDEHKMIPDSGFRISDSGFLT